MEILTTEEQNIELQVENHLKNCSAEKATKYVSDKIIKQYKYYIENEEVWKNIVGYEGLYQVSNFGRVKSFNKNVLTGLGIYRTYEGKIRSGSLLNNYLRVSLCDKGKCKYVFVHRLVAEAFILNPQNKCCVNHKNGIKHNNYVDNLEWVTVSENAIHAYENNLIVIKKYYQNYLINYLI